MSQPRARREVLQSRGPQGGPEEKSLETQTGLGFRACRRDNSASCAVAAPCLVIEGGRESNQLESIIFYSSFFHFQRLSPLQQAGAEKYTIAGVQKEICFCNTSSIVSGGSQLKRVSNLENSSSHSSVREGPARPCRGGQRRQERLAGRAPNRCEH